VLLILMYQINCAPKRLNALGVLVFFESFEGLAVGLFDR
jgi:hypothetical protein